MREKKNCANKFNLDTKPPQLNRICVCVFHIEFVTPWKYNQRAMKHNQLISVYFYFYKNPLKHSQDNATLVDLVNFDFEKLCTVFSKRRLN